MPSRVYKLGARLGRCLLFHLALPLARSSLQCVRAATVCVRECVSVCGCGCVSVVLSVVFLCCVIVAVVVLIIRPLLNGHGRFL